MAILVFGGRARAETAAAPPLTITRSNLAQNAVFTVTTTIAPKEGSKSSQTMRVEVNGNRARLTFQQPQLGEVVYLANDKGMFFYIPANKVAQKMALSGGAEAALKIAFSQINDQLKTARRIGRGVLQGQPVDIYQDAGRGATLYLSRQTGFRLPIKTVVKNAGGTRTISLSNIKVNSRLADSRFSLPAGVQIIESDQNGGGAPAVPGFPGAGG